MPQPNKINWGEIPFPPELQVQAWKDPDPININKLKELAIKMEAARFDEFVEGIRPAPIPPPPIPISKLVVIDEVEVHVPMWANYITQDADGYIQAWELEPHQMGRFINPNPEGGQHKEIMKPNYEVIIKEC